MLLRRKTAKPLPREDEDSTWWKEMRNLEVRTGIEVAEEHKLMEAVVIVWGMVLMTERAWGAGEVQPQGGLAAQPAVKLVRFGNVWSYGNR